MCWMGFEDNLFCRRDLDEGIDERDSWIALYNL